MKHVPGILTLFVVLFVFGWIARDWHGGDAPAIAAARDTVYRTDTLYRAAKAEAEKAAPITAAAKGESDKAAALVAVVEPGKIALRLTPSAAPSVVLVPLQVTDLIAKQATTIAAQSTEIALLKNALTAADVTIAARDRLIAELNPPRCSRKCGFVLGGLAVGLSYRFGR